MSWTAWPLTPTETLWCSGEYNNVIWLCVLFDLCTLGSPCLMPLANIQMNWLHHYGYNKNMCFIWASVARAFCASFSSCDSLNTKVIKRSRIPLLNSWAFMEYYWKTLTKRSEHTSVSSRLKCFQLSKLDHPGHAQNITARPQFNITWQIRSCEVQTVIWSKENIRLEYCMLFDNQICTWQTDTYISCVCVEDGRCTTSVCCDLYWWCFFLLGCGGQICQKVCVCWCRCQSIMRKARSWLEWEE